MGDNAAEAVFLASLPTGDKGQLTLRRESVIASCYCTTVPYTPHRQGEHGCTGIPVVASRWVTDWEVANQ